MAQIRFSTGPDPLWETVLSLTLLGGTARRAVFDPWRQQARTGLRRLAPQRARMLRALAPPVGDFPDFLTPAQGAGGLEAGIDAVLSTPRRFLRRDLAVLSRSVPWAGALAAGDPAVLRELGAALRDYHAAAVAPYEGRIRVLVDGERAARARAVLDHGSGGALASLGPAFRWRAPVLEADYPVDRDLHLRGRGLLLIPSAFCWRTPVTLIDPELPPVLVYPSPRGVGWWSDPAPGTTSTGGPGPLAHLLGATRAHCLRLVEDGAITGELARRLGVSPASASRHATALREAGLVTSTRCGPAVLHTLTPLGRDLLHTAAATRSTP
ncbi:ArsR/SmtB family transcription factor [Streptomyces sp. NPDC086766]|uniref:ArsR/SmtB family transcription factor n=1 Tax=Streptomyces sp. NPDC086766 TaxID=3365754 RepID=UPI00381D3F5E